MQIVFCRKKNLWMEDKVVDRKGTRTSKRSRNVSKSSEVEKISIEEQFLLLDNQLAHEFANLLHEETIVIFYDENDDEIKFEKQAAEDINDIRYLKLHNQRFVELIDQLLGHFSLHRLKEEADSHTYVGRMNSFFSRSEDQAKDIKGKLKSALDQFDPNKNKHFEKLLNACLEKESTVSSRYINLHNIVFKFYEQMHSYAYNFCSNDRKETLATHASGVSNFIERTPIRRFMLPIVFGVIGVLVSKYWLNNTYAFKLNGWENYVLMAVFASVAGVSAYAGYMRDYNRIERLKSNLISGLQKIFYSSPEKEHFQFAHWPFQTGSLPESSTDSIIENLIDKFKNIRNEEKSIAKEISETGPFPKYSFNSNDKLVERIRLFAANALAIVGAAGIPWVGANVVQNFSQLDNRILLAQNNNGGRCHVAMGVMMNESAGFYSVLKIPKENAEFNPKKHIVQIPKNTITKIVSANTEWVANSTTPECDWLQAKPGGTTQVTTNNSTSPINVI